MNGEDILSADERAEARNGERVIETEQMADWYLANITASLDEEARVIEAHQALLRRIRAQRHSLMYLYDSSFEVYCRQKIEESRSRSWILPHGTVACRRQGATVAIVDREAAIEYCQSEAEFQAHVQVRTEVVLDARTYASVASAQLKHTGELLPGVEIKPAGETFVYSGRKEYQKAVERGELEGADLEEPEEDASD